MGAKINECFVILILWCCIITKINYFFNEMQLFLTKYEALARKAWTADDFVIDGQTQHTCLNIQEYCLDMRNRQLLGAT